MGIRDRIKKRIKSVVGGGDADPPQPAPQPTPAKADGAASDKPWYMDGDDIDGWDHTNADGSGGEE